MDLFISVLLWTEAVLVASLVVFFICLALWGGPFRLASAAQIEADWRRAEAVSRMETSGSATEHKGASSPTGVDSE